MIPETRYTHSGRVSIAYQIVGHGPIDLILVPGWPSNIELFWEEPNIVRFFEKLTRFSRLILFDKRGTGLSDRSVEAATLEERMDDVRAVLDAVGSARAALLGYSEGGTMCLLFAATFPDRTAGLITIGSYARRLRAPDYPFFTSREEAHKAVDAAAADWGGPVWIDIRMPSVMDDPVIRQRWARFLRMSASASAAAALQRLNIEIDVRHVLPSIRVPTLIMHGKADRAVPIGAGRYMADHIPNAKFVEIDTIDHLPFYEKSDEFIHHIQTFLTGSSTPVVSESRVSTLMFTDIAGSTEMAVTKGNLRFADLLDVHHAAVRSELARYRGAEINTAGDGFLASFDGPGRAIKCAGEIVKSLEALWNRLPHRASHRGVRGARGSAARRRHTHCRAGRGARIPAPRVSFADGERSRCRFRHSLHRRRPAYAQGPARQVATLRSCQPISIFGSRVRSGPTGRYRAILSSASPHGHP